MLLLVSTIVIAGLMIYTRTALTGTAESTAEHEYRVHHNVTATVFWVGEPASDDNHQIDNRSSMWDAKWMEHYGGIDDPHHRIGYLPSRFIPHENPFYCALPYSDFVDGNMKSDAVKVVPWARGMHPGPSESVCKNRWVKITRGRRTVFAQWEDAGPFRYNDIDYVFGEALPKNRVNDRAGIDVSPAVRDYLGFTEWDGHVDWRFVADRNVTPGPWMRIVTSSQVTQ
jgi:hypothetical protein